ncbi:type IV conjugative transfer system protein TraL [Thiothrix subterranea]|uniref:Type IV conjugative transfer system protein TraL n=1 Tax=Thiothrix subterranea TaxID=2735563 RepID=A0AA51QWV6_9GAMM|nr:type IV conjugative transfer system protein TraL [Thiothrix subterranea]MDQ5767923.1 type IV conjugative transfer system protein TraL [Thiothrix subterranea]WML86618.1 type IV conjugative transfer system protein TraL [Thiothrix subterranea]
MSSHTSLGQYYIPRLLDAPPKAFYWDMDEFMAMVAPIGIGLILDWFVIGTALGLLAGYAVAKLKAGRGAWYMLHALYWYLGVIRLKSTPPSHIREYIG